MPRTEREILNDLISKWVPLALEYAKGAPAVTEAEFTEAGVPLPTDYRVYYEPASGKLDVQLSRVIKYANDPIKTSSHGPEDWLDRLPKVYGQYLPKPID